MANMFTLILFIMTSFTGLLWCLNKFVLIQKQQEHKITTQIIKNNQIKSNVFKEFWSKFYYLLEVGASFFPVLSAVLIIRSFIYEPFQIPSSSMIPTLLINDFVLVEKFAYGIKDPVFQKILVETNHPKRGDIAVFKYPDNPSLNYIKRVIGIPGDKITYNFLTKEVTIQPECSFENNCKKNLFITYSDVKSNDFVQAFKKFENNKLKFDLCQMSDSKTKKNNDYFIERKETLDNITHGIVTIPIIHDYPNMYYQQPGQQLSTWVVPSKHYFMMGDNRDNSSDSRYWGFVPESNLIGKATVIWMSIEKQEGKWFTGVRLNRIGKIH